MIGTGDGKQFETEFDYLVDIGGWGRTANRMPLEATEKPAGAFFEEGRYPSSGALSSYTLSDAEDPIKAWDQLAMMDRRDKVNTIIGGRRVGEGGGGLSKPANENTQPLSKGPEGKDYRLNDNRQSHSIPEGLSADQINKLKEIRGDVLGPTVKPDLKAVNTDKSEAIKRALEMIDRRDPLQEKIWKRYERGDNFVTDAEAKAIAKFRDENPLVQRPYLGDKIEDKIRLFYKDE